MDIIMMIGIDHLVKNQEIGPTGSILSCLGAVHPKTVSFYCRHVLVSSFSVETTSSGPLGRHLIDGLVTKCCNWLVVEHKMWQ